MSAGLFITGTDTGVGKTYVTARLVRGLRAQGVDAVGFKPICCGGREDAEALHAAADGALTLNEVNPVWLRAPVAPYVASLIENRAVDLDLIREIYGRLRARHATVLVEGVGGWLVPIQRDFTTADLAAECGLPVAVVVGNRLGSLNHTALTVRAIREAKLPCAGLIFNAGVPASVEPSTDDQTLARATNRSVLEEWLGLPILASVEAGQSEMSIQW